MKKSNIAVATAVSGLLALGAATMASPAIAADKEKCYGVAKAGANDCATKTSSCAGTSTEDNQADAFIMVPKGLCDRLAGSSTGEPA
uniref:BufA1 family periplasmic bufferin-type metallophore n=1 Tax=Thaumasiovibrio occultus TaxID=1891184 RepID=UPI000B36213F|nr:DUF2282 domain-containing protein [Thaumasiovibrio occultus]